MVDVAGISALLLSHPQGSLTCIPQHRSVLVCSPSKIQDPLSYVLLPVRARSRSPEATGYPRVVPVRALY